MQYLFQRVVHNGNGWAAPTPGRLRFTGDGDYLEETGFGHEDWNLSHDICADGYSYGYMYFRPKNADGPFNIMFATYDKGEGWALCGHYLRATFSEDGAVFPRNVLRRRALELTALDGPDRWAGTIAENQLVRISSSLEKKPNIIDGECVRSTSIVCNSRSVYRNHSPPDSAILHTADRVGQEGVGPTDCVFGGVR